MEQELTRWFQGRTPPARIGIYEVKYPERQCSEFQRWNGKTWRTLGDYPSLFGVNPRDKWRGLAHPPKEQQ